MNFRAWLETKLPSNETKEKLYDKITTDGIPVRRGTRPFKKGKEYSTDTGDFGRGIYYTTNYYQAKQYGEISKSILKLQNPLIIDSQEAYQLSNKYNTVVIPDEEILNIINQYGKDDLEKKREEIKMRNAQQLTQDMLDDGYDGLVVIVDSRMEIIDYRPYK